MIAGGKQENHVYGVTYSTGVLLVATKRSAPLVLQKGYYYVGFKL